MLVAGHFQRYIIFITSLLKNIRKLLIIVHGTAIFIAKAFFIFFTYTRKHGIQFAVIIGSLPVSKGHA